MELMISEERFPKYAVIEPNNHTAPLTFTCINLNFQIWMMEQLN